MSYPILDAGGRTIAWELQTREPDWIKMELTLLGSLPTSNFVCSIWCLDSVRSLTMHALSYATTSFVELADSRFESHSCYLPARVGLHALVFCGTEASVGDLELFCCVFLLVLALKSQL